MCSVLKLVEFSNFRLFIIFSNLWQKKKNLFGVCWFGFGINQIVSRRHCRLVQSQIRENF